MRTLFECVHDVRETQGTNAKLAMLSQCVDENPLFHELIYRVYSTKFNYNVRNFQTGNIGESELEEHFAEYLHLLDRLSTREITGNAARDAVVALADKLNGRGQALLKRTLSRTLDFGVNDKGINKVVPSLLPSNSYMRCSGFNKEAIQKWFNSGDGVIAQEKMDGMFVVVSPDHHYIRTRAGKYFNPDLFHQVWEDLKGVVGARKVFHGEILTCGENGEINPREISNGILNSTLKKETFPGDYMIFFWDCVSENSEDGIADRTPYGERFKAVLEYTKNCSVCFPVKGIEVTAMDGISHFYKEIVSEGGEGLVIKNLNAPWENKTSKMQLKMKQEVDVDLKIVGYRAGKGKFEGMVGSVICESADGLLQVDCSGMNDAMRAYITDNQEQLKNTIICVKANSVMENDDKKHSLFLPRFVELREDKSEADSFERIKELFKTF